MAPPSPSTVVWCCSSCPLRCCLRHQHLTLQQTGAWPLTFCLTALFPQCAPRRPRHHHQRRMRRLLHHQPHTKAAPAILEHTPCHSIAHHLTPCKCTAPQSNPLPTPINSAPTQSSPAAAAAGIASSGCTHVIASSGCTHVIASSAGCTHVIASSGGTRCPAPRLSATAQALQWWPSRHPPSSPFRSPVPLCYVMCM
jgi:hypothetical protein